MTQITEEQKQPLEAASVRVAAKLLAFHAGLPADEQLVLDLAFCRLVDGEQAAIGEEVDARGDRRRWRLPQSFCPQCQDPLRAPVRRFPVGPGVSQARRAGG